MRNLLAILIVAKVLLACSAPASSSAPTAPIADATGNWTLVRGTDGGVPIRIVADHPITLTVDGRTIAGRAACNTYGGEIVVVDGGLRFSPMSMTEMACDEPSMTAEASYVAALGKVRGAARVGDRLTLTGPGVELTFERRPPA
jgi:heat shock protein HslJ